MCRTQGCAPTNPTSLRQSKVQATACRILYGLDEKAGSEAADTFKCCNNLGSWNLDRFTPHVKDEDGKPLVVSR
jgi:hypothetical protein